MNTRVMDIKNNWLTTAVKLYETQQKLKYFEELKAKLSSQLKELSNNETAEIGEFEFLRFTRPGNIIYKDIEVLKTIDLESYRANPVEVWKLSYKPKFD